MDKIFRIGDFTFRLCCAAEVKPPENFMKFEYRTENAWRGYAATDDEADAAAERTAPEYTYHIKVADRLPRPKGQVIARRPDLVVFRQADGAAGAGETAGNDIGAGGLEGRLIGVKGSRDYYACYEEAAADRAEVILAREQIKDLRIDPVFTSLLALERRLVRKDQVILHCAYVEYQGEAVLFSAPSETGKTTQANLWEKYRGSRTVNGDRALLGKRDGRWTAQGWPVCGTSEICHNEALPIRAVVMLSQAKENRAEKLTPGQAFPLLYSQITVNKWNMQDHIHTLDVVEDLLGSVPVYHLGCTISEEAVECLAEALGYGMEASGRGCIKEDYSDIF